MNFLVETSARHVHVTQEVLEQLFGEGFQLTVRKELSQPGQYASDQKVTVVGPKGQLNMSILGPCRDHTQIEVSFTDARALGVTPPVRESGDIAGSAPCKLVGPAGEVEVKEGVIVAKRHLHATPEDAEKLGVKNGDIIAVKLSCPGRETIYGDTVVRVSPKYALAMHIDTDECNAASAFGKVFGEIAR